MVYISDLRKRMDALEKVLPPFYLSQFRTTAGGLRSLRPELSFQNKDIDELDHFLCVLERAAITDIVEYASKKKELNGNADCEALAELSRIYQYLLYTTL